MLNGLLNQVSLLRICCEVCDVERGGGCASGAGTASGGLLLRYHTVSLMCVSVCVMRRERMFINGSLMTRLG